jgi:hypothetical protein
VEPIHTGGTVTVPESSAVDRVASVQHPTPNTVFPPVTIAAEAATTVTTLTTATTCNVPAGHVPPELSRISEDSHQEKPSHHHLPQV